jgi:flavin-dependent dehydrogenase
MPILSLKDNSKVIIIGGGPAGCFFALHTLNLIKERGISLNLKILEQRDFTTAGPKGCNMCAGIIGGRVVDEIGKLGIEIERKVIREDIDGFRVFLDGMSAEIKKRAGNRVYTVFRSQGPLGVSEEDEIVGFDSFLLKKTVEKGISFEKATVLQVIPGGESENTVIYRTPDGSEHYEKADLVVVACGVNTALTRMFDYGYVPPNYWHTCQAEIQLEKPESVQKIIHIFSRKKSPFLFTALTPKGRYVTVTGIGRWVKFNDLLYEMEMLSIKKLFPGELKVTCHCHPRIPVSTAEKPYYDRIVMVGDACVSRYLKNGIESALFTSLWAAKTAVEQGIDKDSFERNYKKHYHEYFTIDNRYGKAMFFLHRIVSSSSILSRSSINILKEEAKSQEKQHWLSDILWHMFAGDKPYRRIFRKMIILSKLYLILKNIFR